MVFFRGSNGQEKARERERVDSGCINDALRIKLNERGRHWPLIQLQEKRVREPIRRGREWQNSKKARERDRGRGDSEMSMHS